MPLVIISTLTLILEAYFNLTIFAILGLPDEVLAAPIAQDWVKYNEIDNQGELGPKSEFMTNLK